MSLYFYSNNSNIYFCLLLNIAVQPQVSAHCNNNEIDMSGLMCFLIS